jgi:hypothetical protein
VIVKVIEDLVVGDKLDSDGDLEIELYNDNHDCTESKWLNRESAIKLTKHLIELFRLDVKEV